MLLIKWKKVIHKQRLSIVLMISFCAKFIVASFGGSLSNAILWAVETEFRTNDNYLLGSWF